MNLRELIKSSSQNLSEELKGNIHPEAHKVLKHIDPQYHSVYTPWLKVGVYKGDYADRAAVLKAATEAGHIINQDVAKGSLREFAPGNSNNGSGDDGSKNTLAQAVEYIKKRYPNNKKYLLDGSHRYMDLAAVADWVKQGKIGDAPVDPMKSAIEHLGMVENPTMSGMDSTHVGREDWWHTYENNRRQIAALHFVGQSQGWIIIAGDTERNLSAAVKVFRDSGILPDLLQTQQHRRDKAASRLSKLSTTPLQVGDMFGNEIARDDFDTQTQSIKRVSVGWDIWEVLEFTKTGKIKARKVKSPYTYPNTIGEIKLFDPKGRIINNKRGLEAGREYKNQQGVAEGSDSLTFWKQEAKKAGGAENIDWYAIGVEHGEEGIVMNPPYGVGAKAVKLYSKGLEAGEQGLGGHNPSHSHQYDVTMKHAKNPTVQQRMAAHDIKPGIAGYRDRIDLLRDLERTDRFREEGVAETPYQGKGGPGWMLREDPTLAQQIKQKIQAVAALKKPATPTPTTNKPDNLAEEYENIKQALIERIIKNDLGRT